MKNYSLKQDIKSGKRLLGTWAQIASQETVEIIGYTGYDFAIVDMEHGCMGLETAESLVRSADAAGLPVIVRVLDNQPTMIMKALETGAAGVLIPGVTSGAAAEQAVRSAKYAPMGVRGACPFVRSSRHSVDGAAEMLAQNDSGLVVLLIEGKQALEEYDGIIATPGLDCVMVGPVDLSFSLGVGGQYDHPLVTEAVRELTRKAAERGIPMLANIFYPDAAGIRKEVERYRALGIGTLLCNADKSALIAGLNYFAQNVRAHW